MPKNRALSPAKILEKLDRWGTVLLIFLIPWQARIILRQGYLAGAPSEPRTVSIFAFEILLLAVLVVRFSVLSGGRREYVLRAVNKPFAAFSAVIVLAFFSIVISQDRTATIIQLVRLLEGMALFFAIVTAPREREARIAFVAAAVIQSLIAVAELVFGHIPGSTLLGVSAQSPAAAGASVVEAGAMRLLRAYGTLPHPNILGGMLAAAILLARPLYYRVSVKNIAVSVVLSAGLFLTFSRLAWIALAVGLVVQLIFACRDRVFLVHIGAILSVFVIMSGLFWPFMAARVTAVGRLETKSVATRVASLSDAVTLIKAHPLSGVGAGAFTAAVFAIDPGRGAYGYEPAHSVFALTFAELGIFGFALALVLFYNLIILAWRSGKPGLAAALVILAAGDHWPVTTMAGVMIYFAAWALSLRGGCDGKITHKSGAVILSEKDPSKVLLLYRDGSDYCDWTFPKGHMEAGESYEEAMRREIWEETGLVVDIIDRLPNREYTTGHGHEAVAHFFLVRSLDDGKLRLERGHSKNKLEWVPIANAEERLSFENMKEYFRKIRPQLKIGG